MSGVEDSGFVKKTLPEILSEIEEDEKSLISRNINVLPTSMFGQINGIFSDKLRELWDVAEAVYRSLDPDYATGDSLDQRMALVGVRRLAPQKSAVLLDRIYLEDGKTIDAGDMVSAGTSGPRFVLRTALTNSSGFTKLFSVYAESYDYGPIPGFANALDNIVTPEDGWKAKAAIVAANAEPYTLDGLHLAFRTDQHTHSTPFVDFSGGDPWSAQDVIDFITASIIGIEGFDVEGYVGLNSPTDGIGSTIQIVSGSAVTVLGFDTEEVAGMNSTDANLGRLTETDAEARLRREEELAIAGSGTVDSIRAKLLALSYVVQAFVFENTTMEEVDGIPPKSIECLVYGGGAETEQEIAETIWNAKDAGIEAFGSTSKTVTDSQGIDHTVGFSRPTEVPIYMELTVSANEDDFPEDGETQIKTALKNLGDLQQAGQNIVALKFKSESFEIAGVTDVPVFFIDIVDPPTNEANLIFTSRQLPTFDIADIDLTVVFV